MNQPVTSDVLYTAYFIIGALVVAFTVWIIDTHAPRKKGPWERE